MKVDGVGEVESGPVVPLVIGAVAFAVSPALLLLQRSGAVGHVGAVLCLVVIAGCFAVELGHDPSFESWELSMKAVQLPLGSAPGWLAIRGSRQSTSG